MDKQTHINFTQDFTAPVNLDVSDLEHLASCDYCMEQFADYIEEQELLSAPRYLKEDILKKSRQLDVQIVAKSNQASKKLELFYYALKVGFATVFALVFLIMAPSLAGPSFSTGIAHASGTHYREAKPFSRLYEQALDITDIINGITNQFNNHKTEVSSDDK